MMQKLRLDWSPWSLHQHYNCAKFLVCILLIGLSVRLLLFSSWVLCPFGEHPAKPSSSASSSSSQNASVQTSQPEMALDMPGEGPRREKCDLFDGEWVPHPSGPVYDNESCLFIQDHQNCLSNGRPDRGYLYWRWKPRGCDIPVFDAAAFLDAMRNKWFAFIGDSISRNHIQSLLCLLSRAENPMDVYHDEKWQSRRWYFPSHNFSLSVVWSPFLVKAEISDGADGTSNKDIQVHLDVLDELWIPQLKNFDYVVTSGGKWFTRTAVYWENNTVVGCHYCSGMNLTELGYDYGYRKALDLVLSHIAASGYKGTVLFRTSTPDHFEGGEWSSGGTCRRARPFKEGEAAFKEVDRVLRVVEMEVFERAAARARSHGVDLRLMDTTHLSLLRPDGHPGPYMTYQPFAKDKNGHVQNDCLHWCLPGPIDFWNDLLMELVLRHRR